MNEKLSFVMYVRHRALFVKLNGEQALQLNLAIFDFVEHGKIPDFSADDRLDIAFSSIRNDLERDAAKWEESKARMSAGGKKGMTNRWNNDNKAG